LASGKAQVMDTQTKQEGLSNSFHKGMHQDNDSNPMEVMYPSGSSCEKASDKEMKEMWKHYVEKVMKGKDMNRLL
jgi:hypothetical protein